MGDCSETFLEFRSKRRYYDLNARTRCNELLSGEYLNLDEDSISWILNNIDCFVRQSQGNETVQQVYWWPHASFNGQDDDGACWDKVGEAIGNLQALEMLSIATFDFPNEDDYSDDDDDDDEVVHPGPIPDWEMLGRILRHVGQNVTLVIDDERLRSVEEVQPFARAISGHSSITSLQDNGRFPYESLDTLFFALATLPALESVTLRAPEVTQADESTLAHPESLTELLRVPTLQSVHFYRFSFTRLLCQATANALIEGTAVTEFQFIECSFSAAEESAAILATGLSRNTSVTSISVRCSNARALCNALAMALPSNSTLRHLGLNHDDDSDCLSPVFSALGQNTGLKTLTLMAVGSMGEASSLSTAMKDGLGMNKTLESLELTVRLCDENSAHIWCRALSFLRTNKALKSLVISLNAADAKESCVASTLRSDIACMLQKNVSLESYSIQNWNYCSQIKAEDYFVLVAALQHNTVLKTLRLHRFLTTRLNDNESKQMTSLLKKNYALESLPNIDLEDPAAGDVSAILRLNAAGRRYLVQDGCCSISKGVQVLSAVSNDVNCVFLHLLENPRLCDRNALEMVIGAADVSNGSSTKNPTDSNGEGKREHASAHTGKDSRRRLV
jgi:hypothetical protein